MADHVADSVEALAELHREHYSRASRLQRGIEGLTRQLGRPAMVLLLLAAIGVWASWAALAGGGRVDQPSFAWLELAATLAGLMVSILILVTQSRDDELAARREQLTLELALLADKKSAKVIQLLEELRRDHPDVAGRVDQESADMARAADPQKVMAAIDEAAGERRPR